MRYTAFELRASILLACDDRADEDRSMSGGHPHWPPGVEEIEHTADWAIRVSASSAAGLFCRAAQGLYHMVGMRVDESPLHEKRLQLAAVDWESLLVAWLNELLFLQGQKNEAYPEIEILSLDSKRIEALLRGGQVVAWTRDIKAVTYHNLRVIAGPRLWQATVVFDV
jgi:SHS2 domain-containing protein